jgi:hypothetical protein
VNIQSRRELKENPKVFEDVDKHVRAIIANTRDLKLTDVENRFVNLILEGRKATNALDDLPLDSAIKIEVTVENATA